MPDPARTRVVLDALTRAAPEAAVLWRGAELDGGDVDLVVRSGRDVEVLEALGSLGLAPWPQSPGQTTWRGPQEDVVLDVWLEWTWPAAYPPIAGVLRRAGTTPEGWGLAAPEDRLAIFAADAIGGRPLASLRPKVARALSEPGAATRLRELTDGRLAAVVAAGLPDGEVLSAPRAFRGGLASRRGRLALLGRIREAPPARPPAVAGAPRGLLITLSGLDGAGKSSTGLALAAEFERRGLPSMVAWTRLGSGQKALHRIAGAVRSLLGREMGESSRIDPAAAVADRGAPSRASTPSRLVGPTWVTLVALAHVRRCRRLARVRASGVHVVCDRWLADAIVDLRLRYGPHRFAEWVLRAAMPRPDLALLLEVGPEAAAVRKPGDQDAATLALMQTLYAEMVIGLGLTCVDAEQASSAVRDEVFSLATERLSGPAAPTSRHR